MPTFIFSFLGAGLYGLAWAVMILRQGTALVILADGSVSNTIVRTLCNTFWVNAPQAPRQSARIWTALRVYSKCGDHDAQNHQSLHWGAGKTSTQLDYCPLCPSCAACRGGAWQSGPSKPPTSENTRWHKNSKESFLCTRIGTPRHAIMTASVTQMRDFAQRSLIIVSVPDHTRVCTPRAYPFSSAFSADLGKFIALSLL